MHTNARIAKKSSHHQSCWVINLLMTRSAVNSVVRTIRTMNVIMIPSPQSGVPLGMSSAMDSTVNESECEQCEKYHQENEEQKGTLLGPYKL